MIGAKKFPLFLVAAALCLPQQMVWAGPREDAAAAMVRCDAIRDNAAWLECHEKATAQMRAALMGNASRPAPAPPVQGRIAQPGIARFGDENLPARPRAAVPKKLVARTEDVSFSKNGYFTIKLDNGQWWRQIDGDTNYARFRMPANRNIVTIERGFLGSYNLHIRGLNQGYKVNRIR
jgi:hypothetical protein